MVRYDSLDGLPNRSSNILFWSNSGCVLCLHMKASWQSLVSQPKLYSEGFAFQLPRAKSQTRGVGHDCVWEKIRIPVYEYSAR